MSTVAKHFDYLVLGGGSGGIASARRAAEHGAKVGLIEGSRIGGTCVNVGCVPKKVMFAASFVMEVAKDHAPGYGVQGSAVTGFDWAHLKAKRDAYIKRLNGIYDTNLERSGIDRINGKGKFVGEKTIEVDGQRYSGDHVLIATGGYPWVPESVKGAEHCITSDGFFDLESLPAKTACIGAGYIAVELAGIMGALGSESHLFYRNDRFLRSFDTEAVDFLTSEAEHSLNLHPSSGNDFEIEKDPETGKLSVKTAQGVTGGFDCVVLAVGRRPAVDIGLEEAGVKLDGKGFIGVDEFQQTSASGVYAVGDVTDAPQLTPVAIAAGRKLSERLFNNREGLKQCFKNVPSVVFSHPPYACVGMTEDEAKKEHGEDSVKCYKSTFTNMFFSMSDRKAKTFMKLVCVGKEEKVVGIHLVGLAVDEMIQGFSIAVVAGLTKADFDATVAVHPSAAEELVTMR